MNNERQQVTNSLKGQHATSNYQIHQTIQGHHLGNRQHKAPLDLNRQPKFFQSNQQPAQQNLHKQRQPFGGMALEDDRQSVKTTHLAQDLHHNQTELNTLVRNN